MKKRQLALLRRTTLLLLRLTMIALMTAAFIDCVELAALLMHLSRTGIHSFESLFSRYLLAPLFYSSLAFSFLYKLLERVSRPKEKILDKTFIKENI